MLKIIEYIKKHGLEKALTDFALKHNSYAHKILLKYNQIESPMEFDEVQDCRGLILDENFNIMSLGFRKFFNVGEPLAANVNFDWDSLLTLEKVDGTFIQVYFDYIINEWCVGTTGMAEGEGMVGCVNNLTFKQLFNNTLLKYFSNIEDFYIQLQKGYTYMFELCSPWNIVVKQHQEASITFLGMRNLKTLQEIKYEKLPNIGIPIVKFYSLSNIADIKHTFENMPYSEEGYVIVDKYFNRLKIKNPAYVAIHHIKFSTAKHYILDIIKTNEVDEFVSVFIDRKAEVNELQEKYNKLINLLEEGLVILKQDFPLLETHNNILNNWKNKILEVCKKYQITEERFFYKFNTDGFSKINKYKTDISVFKQAITEILSYLPPTDLLEDKKLFAQKVFDLTKNINITELSCFYFAYQNGEITTAKDFLNKMDTRKLYDLILNKYC
jgi:hypothetical protein